MLIRYYTPSPRNHYEGYKGLEEPRKPRSKTLLKKKEKKRREEEIVNPHRYIWWRTAYSNKKQSKF